MTEELQLVLDNLEEGQMVFVRNGNLLQVYAVCPDCGIRTCYNWSEDQIAAFRAVYQDISRDF